MTGQRQKEPRFVQFRRRFLLGAIMLLYTGLSFYQLELPGLHYDEAFEAVPALQLWQGQPASLFRGSGLNLAGRSWPLMTQDYIGAINTYLALPFIALLGPTTAALRVMSILVGAACLWLSYRLAGLLTGRSWAGLLAALLLAVDPTFIFWNRQGIFVTAVTAPIGLAAAYCWLRRLQVETGSGQPQPGSGLQPVSGAPNDANRLKPRPHASPSQPGFIRRAFLGWRWSLAGAFFFGLGLYAKVLFIWLIAALVGALLLLHLDRLSAARGRWPWRPAPLELLLAGLAFLLGCAPLLIYNLQTGGTWLSISQNAATSYYGVNNLAIGANLIERLGQLSVFLSGGQFWYLGQVFSNLWAPLLLGLVAVGVVILTMRRSYQDAPLPGEQARLLPLPPAKAALLPLLVIALVTLASIATVSALWITHFAILMPWPALALAVGSWFILDPSPSGRGASLSPFPGREGGRGGRSALLLGLGLLLALNLANSLRYHMALAESGGLSSHSDAIYDLSAWLAQRAGGPVVAMDWGLAAPVIYLSGGRVMPVEIFGYDWQSDVQLSSWLENYIAQPATLYLWRAPDEIIFDRSADFKALYRPKDLEETIEEAFYERSGRPLLGVTRLVAQGTAANPPK
jgi:4-amino-4-deoxy-L-arabinose transferase-like glycosyltransferase